VRTIVLVGFMAAGKTETGRILARRLGWTFLDFDAEIEKHAGASVGEIFLKHGEIRFREIERQLTPVLVQRHDSVLATGGGWAVQPDTIDALPGTALSIWLNVSAEEAVRRAAASAIIRPLLEVADPVATARALLQQRKAFYERADIRIDVDGRTPDQVAEDIMQLLDDS